MGVGDSVRPERPTISKRLKESTEDDDPTYVLEENNDTISKVEYEALLQKQSTAAQQETAAPGTGKTPSEDEGTEPFPDLNMNTKTTHLISEPGQRKKRKVAKVIGEEQDEDVANSPAHPPKGATPHNKTSKPKKKLIKLSFSQD